MQKQNKRRQAKRKMAVVHKQPPQLKTNVELHHTYRFRANSSFSGQITTSQIVGSLGAVCSVANTTVVALGASFKITRIEMWAPPASQGTDVTVSCEWVSFGNTVTREVSDTSMSTSIPAHISAKPPRNSLVSFWQLSNAGTGFFNLVAPVGTVIDLSVSWIMQDQDLATLSITIAAGTLGKVYYLPLDHPTAGGTGVLQPVSLVFTD